jgi:hypothetical protein
MQMTPSINDSLHLNIGSKPWLLTMAGSLVGMKS